jgi:predicted ABC-class ATPase
MWESHRLRQLLTRLDGRGYKAYKGLKGEYRFLDYTLFLDRIQGDPFASPSLCWIRVTHEKAQIPEELFSNRERQIAAQDFLARQFQASTQRLGKGIRGTGNSGLIWIDAGGQEVLERTACRITESGIEVRFYLGLPAYGRRIAGRIACEIFFEELPEIISHSIFYRALSGSKFKDFVDLYEDTLSIQRSLESRGLIAFIPDGAILPRRSGIDPRPLKGEAIPFEPPAELRMSFDLPHLGQIQGMGIPEGVTLIIGGGYHGKSTLLDAITAGIHPHIPGDGRELVATCPTAVKIRAEDGRSIQGVDISPFISNLPMGQPTEDFSTENASGSTSQAANIIEALEAGARLLLIDEDTSATNFMIRDERMQALVKKDKEPITPFLDKVQLLHKDYGVSSIIVLGGSGDYFDVANRVLMMDCYRPKDVTGAARKVMARYPMLRRREGGDRFGAIHSRRPLLNFSPKTRVKVRSQSLIQLGRSAIDLGAVETVFDAAQTRTIAHSIAHLAHQGCLNGRLSMEEILNYWQEELERSGLDLVAPGAGDLAYPRRLELAAAINRIWGLKVKR